MAFHFYVWLPRTVRHLAENFVTPEEFEEIMADPDEELASNSTGLPAAIGYTQEGRRLFCVYRVIDDVCVEPVTAYEIEG